MNKPVFEKTDWNEYYKNPSWTSQFTRRITSRILQDVIAKYGVPHPSILELGGANSCFHDSLYSALAPENYCLVDNNEVGMELMKPRLARYPNTNCLLGDVLHLTWDGQFDVVFSVGLIEHFPIDSQEDVIEAHFRQTHKNGLVIITFPTPTWLYQLSRYLIEKSAKWIFQDEVPIPLEQVVKPCSRFGTVVDSWINWPIILTQGIVISRR